MKTAGASAATNAFSSHAKPVQVISAPKRFAGRRHQAYRPVPIHAAPMPSADERRQPAVVDVIGAESTTPAPSSPTRRAASASIASARVSVLKASSSWTRSPESSALGTKPRAPERETSGPKSDESRLETRITAGRVGMAGDARGDVEAVDVGQLHVEKHELRAQPTGLLDGARAVHGLADDVETLRFEQHASAGPKGRVVVNDEDGAVHGVDSRHRA